LDFTVVPTSVSSQTSVVSKSVRSQFSVAVLVNVLTITTIVAGTDSSEVVYSQTTYDGDSTPEVVRSGDYSHPPDGGTDRVGFLVLDRRHGDDWSLRLDRDFGSDRRPGDR
jgi:hypothetical protein